MNKTGQFKIVTILLLSAILHITAQSQNRKYLVLSGIITTESNNNETDKSSVQIIKNNHHTVSFQIPNNNRFRLELEYYAEYKLIFAKKGNQTKTIVVNTDIPGRTLAGTNNLPHFLMAVNLLTEKKPLESLYFGNQVQYVNYSAKSRCFIKTSSALDVDYVQNENFSQDSKIQIEEDEAKLQSYQVF
jgi:hypothetical protein